MKWYQKFAPYNKAIEAGLGYVTTLGALLLTVDNLIPPSVGVPAAAIFGGVGVFRTWYIRNETLVEQVVNASEDLYEDIQHVAHPKVVEAPTPEVVAPVDIQDDDGGKMPNYPVYSAHNDLPTAAITLPASADDPGRHSASAS